MFVSFCSYFWHQIGFSSSIDRWILMKHFETSNFGVISNFFAWIKYPQLTTVICNAINSTANGTQFTPPHRQFDTSNFTGTVHFNWDHKLLCTINNLQTNTMKNVGNIGYILCASLLVSKWCKDLMLQPLQNITMLTPTLMSLQDGHWHRSQKQTV